MDTGKDPHKKKSHLHLLFCILFLLHLQKIIFQEFTVSATNSKRETVTVVVIYIKAVAFVTLQLLYTADVVCLSKHCTVERGKILNDTSLNLTHDMETTNAW